MAIEFLCPNCNRLMRTPDHTAGKKGQCPGCGTLTQIPTQSTATPSPVSPPANAPKPRSEPSGSPGGADDKIEFPCPQCGRPVRIAAAMAGKKGKCPGCGTVFTIPAASAATEPQLSRSDLPADASVGLSPIAPAESSETIEFHCVRCGNSVRTPASMAGKKGRCPNCGAIETIPQPGVRPVAASRPPRPTAPTASPKKAPRRPAPGLTPLGDAPGLTPLPSTDGLIPLDSTPSLVPLDDTGGLTPLDAVTGLTPLEAMPGLTPLDAATGLTPLADMSALTPLDTGGGPLPLGGSGAVSPFAAGSTPTRSLNPYQAPAYTRPRRKSSRPSNATVAAPAIAMIVVASLTLVVVVIGGILRLIGAVGSFGQGPVEASTAYLVGSIAGMIIGPLIQVAIITGSLKMMKFESYSSAMTAAVLCSIPCCTFFCLGMPFGIWAFIVLCLGDVKRQFTS